MNKIFLVAQREYIETVKTKAFIFGVIIAPFIIAAIIYFVGRTLNQQVGPRPPINLAMTDLSSAVLPDIKNQVEEYNKSNQKRQIALEEVNSVNNGEGVIEEQKSRLRSGSINVYAMLDANIVEGSGKMHLYTCGMKASDLDVLWTIENFVNQAAVKERCRIKNVSPELLAELRKNVASEQVELSQGGKESIQKQEQRVTQMMIPFFFMYLMFLGIMMTGQQMLNSIIEEKSSRVIELLLSALRPIEIMGGKILGLGAIGLTMIFLWGIPAYSAAILQGLKVDLNMGLLVYFAIYYILGYILFSSILAGVGSICNTIKEAQSLMGPLTMLLVFPMIAWFNLVRNPEGVLARVLSFIPPMTPMVMMLRLSASDKLPMIEILATIIVLLVAVVIVMWLAAKIFRTGILMYGKRPNAKEVIRWLCQK